ncbi:hypothetical protein C0Q70_15505 [Pomacea canaliculata]|uniref:Uncharacterized protein n=2 Tax=Pomacea canaliculata TaxID=400727 RepID=A0A2T7NV03_POMCA|nr:hypothetical protein C0Q70_15505 [Pomacea canaliculata]
MCYGPYLLFWGLACEACALAGTTMADGGAVYYFVAVFVIRALSGACVQVYRTVWVQGLVKLQAGQSAVVASSSSWLLNFRKRSGKENGIATIANSNPMWHRGRTGVASRRTSAEEASDADAVRNVTVGADVNRHSDRVAGAIYNPAYRLSFQLDRDAGGIYNPAYRPSIQLEPDSGGIYNPAYRPSIQLEPDAGGIYNPAYRPSIQLEPDAGGIYNPAYRPSIQLEQDIGGVTEEITAL